MITLTLGFSKQSKSEYETEFTNDLIQFTNTAELYMTMEDREKFTKTNRIILVKMILAPDIHTMDLYVMMYLEYKAAVIAKVNYKKQQTKLFFDTLRKKRKKD